MNLNFLTRDKLFGLTMGILLMPMIQQAAPFFTVGILSSVQDRLTFPMIQWRIEIVRAAAAAVPCPVPVGDAPIVAAVLDFNQRIAHEQESNRHWYSDYFATDRWNQVKPIEFPCEVKS